MSVITIDRNEEANRYELKLDGELAGFAEYRTAPGRVTFHHTLVFPEHEGKGLGSRLAKRVLDDAVERGETIVPRCPFIAAYLRRHPGVYDDSVAWP
ncbi:GNAT family N-acetyltransferase [Agromyces sp. H66]|uniref:GNAT family N-acetyltransferase n=1 Tax=Agromyces sp. H66 TaxID=2529859 RepID=UPI0020C11CAE|nr:GNAT family N-acetyltransferase [Agromyces sp. H66]